MMHFEIGVDFMFTKYSVSTGERVTDVSMEEEFWNALRDIAADRDTTLSALVKEIVATIDGNADRRRISSVLRTYVLEQYLPKQRPNTRDIYRSTFEDSVLKC
jgi:predicted DNA-binding ribbon-helix-helix protein